MTPKDFFLGNMSDWIPTDMLEDFIAGNNEVVFYVEDGELHARVEE